MELAIKELKPVLKKAVQNPGYIKWPVIGAFSLGFKKGLTNFTPAWDLTKEVLDRPLQRPCTVSAPDMNNGNVVGIRVD